MTTFSPQFLILCSVKLSANITIIEDKRLDDASEQILDGAFKSKDGIGEID